MSDHVRVLERFVSEHKCGFVVASIRAALEENERLKAALEEISQAPTIAMKASGTECINGELFRGMAVKALRGEK